MTDDNIVHMTGEQYAIGPGCITPLKFRAHEGSKKVITHRCTCGKLIRITIEEVNE